MDDKVRAQYAGQILDNPVFKDACKIIKDEVVNLWADCPARDLEGKEYLWQLYRNTNKFEAIFKGYIEAGKLADFRDTEAKKEQSALRDLKDNVTKFWRR